jgi:hypothetical protein
MTSRARRTRRGSTGRSVRSSASGHSRPSWP